MSIPLLFAKRRFNPRRLFASGEQGVWYDPSDFSTMFQDAAGTTPVTAIEQPVGLILDKSGRGNHASQSTTTSCPILRNLYNLLICQTTMATQNVTTLATSYTLRFTGAGTVALSGTATGTLSAGSNAFTATAGTLTLTVSGAVSEAMLTPTNEASLPFQSVTSNTLGSGVYDTDVTKFPPYLFFDGSDDWLSTANINFSATDKVSVFAGVRKLRDTPVGTLIVLGANYLANGAFEIGAPWVYSTVQRDYIVAARGSTSEGSNVNIRAYGSIAPITNVLTANIFSAAENSAASQSVRINAVTKAGASLENLNSTGVFANAAITIGNRPAGGALLNGRIYSLIIRGALTSSPQLEQTERWVAGRTGVTL